ncbi:MAG: LamG domain-containing protein, partial [Candidatus Altiarchaeota archaeon]|nr:LamG domain-containing protein [Candidatus Altiarchaeota archaeon]
VLVYPEEIPQIASLRCYLEYGYAAVQSDGLEGTINYRVRYINGTLMKSSATTVNITTSGKIYFGALMERDETYLVEFYTPKWLVSDTCTARFHDDIITYFSFDEGSGVTAEDFTSDNDGTLYGGTDASLNGPTWTTGNSGSALYFNGSGYYVNIPNKLSMNNTDAITVSAWIKRNIPSIPTQGIVSKGLLSSSPRTWDVGIDVNDRIFWYIANNDTNFKIIYADSVGVDVWEFITATFNGTDTSLYLNGSLITTAAFDWTTMQTSAYSIHVGKLRNQASYFNGSIDDVRIYDRALNDTEILQLYQGTDISRGLVGHWLFDENSGTTAYDTHMWTDGKRDGSLSLDGYDSTYLNIPTHSSFNLMEEGTVEMWIKPVNNDEIFFMYGGGTSNYLRARVETSKIRFIQEVDNVVVTNLVTDTITLDSWNNLIITQNNSFAQMYWNGVAVDHDGQTNSDNWFVDSSTTGAIKLGESSWVNNEFQGIIDELRIYDRALTSEEVSAIYEAYN